MGRHESQTCYISAPAGLDTSGLRRALKELGVHIVLEGQTPAPGDSLIVTLRELLLRADFVCGVVPGDVESANVLFELGLAAGLARPIFVVQPTSSRSPPLAIASYPRVQAELDDVDALKFHLELFLRNAKRAGRAPLTRPSPKTQRRAAVSLDDLHERLRRPARLDVRHLEDVVVEALQRAGVEAVARPRYGHGDVEVQPDLAVWLPDAPPDLGSPILIELAGERPVQVAVEQVRRYLDMAWVRCGLVIWTTSDFDAARGARENVSPKSWPAAPGYVFQLSLDDFLTAIEQNSLVQRLVDQRNRLVHGVR